MGVVTTNHFKQPDIYAVWTKDADVRYKSTSGGAFTELAKNILNKGGLVAGARYNEECLVEHCLVDSLDGLDEIRQSKYMSSIPGNIYKDVKAALEEGRLIGFCGAPCQVLGLYSFLGKDYDNLITMDFICRGMNSPKAFKAWLSELEEREGCKAKKVWFKYKDGGWKSSPKRTRVDFEDGHYVVKEGEDNLYMYGYLTSNLYIRPSCGNCTVKGVPRQGDITLADFWGIESELDDDKGTSMLLINSEKGRDLFDEIRNNMVVHQRNFSEIFNGNPMFSTSAKVPNETHEFLADLDNMSFTDALKKYGGYPSAISRWKKIVKKIKTVILCLASNGDIK
ncbi:Coenzyme F420 hydrogenase/dehydrogenase, beta subunit C-terminal domain [Butyrivibrio fibrisolvens]|uniref:Coenzyme F420 hydrogenase/dehydrogenase, beta subunit C-terminal domain n=1 Tax=Butyrivibrio fibrisolvens TaxID=831 RepID=UPI00040E155F|nr:Coenzyme F420 hydrogenase/dehydrogenase, beta subunit C-terminal domain [Butyrivibrio fibrisolvens]